MAIEVEKGQGFQFSGEDHLTYWSKKFENYKQTKKLRGQLYGTDAINSDDKLIVCAELTQLLNERFIMVLKLECKRN